MTSSYKAMLEWAVKNGHVNGDAKGQDASFLFSLPFTDVGNAERLVTMFGQDLHYNYQMNKWLAWDDTRWNINLNGEVYRRAVATVRAMYAEAGNLETISAGMEEGEERARLAKIAETLSEWARKSEASSKIESMVRRAESITPIPIMMDQLDVDPWVLNVCNGTIDLQTGEKQMINGMRESWRVSLIDTGKTTMTGGRLKRLQDFLQGETFLMNYCDGIADINIDALVQFHREHRKIATVTAVRPPSRFGELILKGNEVTEFSEKSQS